MRKAFTLIVFGFLLVSSVIVILAKDPQTSVSILSVKKNYSRLITNSEETISIPLYFSSNKSFLTEIKSLETSYLKDEYNQMEVNVLAIRYIDNYLDDYNNNYYLYMFDINFSNITVDIIDFEDTILELIYENQDTIEIGVGYINLRFTEVNQSLDLDVYRIYTTVKTIDNKEYISGLVLGLTPLNHNEIVVTNISIGNDFVQTDLYNAKQIDSPVEYDEDIDNILEYPYNSINLASQFSIDLENGLLFIPLAYKEELFMLNRFPIYIEYESNKLKYEYLIDDFMYISENYSLEVANGRLQEYIYYY